MRVLLTGASGFVGGAAIAPLLAAGCDLHAVSRREPADGQGAVWQRARSSPNCAPKSCCIWHGASSMAASGRTRPISTGWPRP